MCFLDDNENKVKLKISKDTADKLRDKANCEYDYENNILKNHSNIFLEQQSYNKRFGIRIKMNKIGKTANNIADKRKGAFL